MKKGTITENVYRIQARGYMTVSAIFLQISTLHREKSDFSPKRLEPSEIIEPEIQIRRNKKIGCGVQHTEYPETTNVTDNNKRS